MSQKPESTLPREFDPGKFADKKWKVIEGTIPGDPPATEDRFVVLTTDDKVKFHLTYYQGNQRRDFEQDLYYNPYTRTLDSDPSDGKPERCLSFWHRRSRNASDRIFAIRRVDVGIPPENQVLFPWEDPRDNGTWGAEEG